MSFVVVVVVEIPRGPPRPKGLIEAVLGDKSLHLNQEEASF